MYQLVIGLLLLSMCAQATAISGTAEDFKGKTIKAVFINPFSEIESELSSGTINESGHFSISFKSKEAQQINLIIEGFRANLFITPAGEYKLKIYPWDPASAPPLSPVKNLSFDLLEDDDQQTNTRIWEVNQALAKFQSKNYMAYLHNRTKDFLPQLSDSFRLLESDNEFVNHYMKYVFGRQQLMAHEAKKEVFKNYLNQDFVLTNPAFVDLFNEFYSHWSDRYVSDKESAELNRYIFLGHTDSLVQMFMRNDYINEEIRAELVLAQELHRKALDKEKIGYTQLISCIKKLNTSSQFPMIRDYTALSLDKLLGLAKGSLAPDFVIETDNGETIRLSELKGKYVYLGFWSANCETCIKSMMATMESFQLYKDSIDFLSINIDANRELYDRIRPQFNYPWPIEYGGNQTQILSDYKVVALPLFYLIDKDGRFLQSPAEEPGSGIELVFKGLFHDPDSGKPEVWDWNKQKPGKN